MPRTRKSPSACCGSFVAGSKRSATYWLHLVERSGQSGKRLVEGRGRALLPAHQQRLHERDEVGSAVVSHQGLGHLPVDRSRAVAQQPLAQDVARGALSASGEGVEQADEFLGIARPDGWQKLVLDGFAVVSVNNHGSLDDEKAMQRYKIIHNS